MLELEHRFRVVDVHTQLDPDLTTTIRGRTTTPERHEREMRQAGIVRTVVFPGPRQDNYLTANNAVARHAVDRPFVAFARINGPRRPPNTPLDTIKNLTANTTDTHVTADDIERYGYDDRFHGFKLNPIQDGLPSATVLDQLDDLALPVLVHAGDHYPPTALEDTLLDRDFPVIIAHFGGYPLNRDHMTDAIDLLDRHDECYLDTSVVRFRDLIERAMLEHPDRVLFGSGAPDVHPNVAVMELLTLDIPEDGMRKAFTNNPSRVVPALSPDQPA